MSHAVPKPAASVVLVRASEAGAPEPLEVYMIRRKPGMRFLGGYYAFPGGKVDPDDAADATLGRCRGLAASEAAAILDEASDGTATPAAAAGPALAYWVTAVRELLEESGVLLACDAGGRPVRATDPEVAGAIEQVRKALVVGAAPFGPLLAAVGWFCDLRPLRHLAHFVTPTSSPIRFTAHFFLCPVPPDQVPRLFTEETSEAFWVHPGEGYRRFQVGEMPMAEPAEYGLGYLARFDSLEELLAAHADRRHKFCGIVHRIDDFYTGRFDWNRNVWTGTPPPGVPGRT